MVKTSHFPQIVLTQGESITITSSTKSGFGKNLSFWVSCPNISPRPWNEAMLDYFGHMGLKATVQARSGNGGYFICLQSDHQKAHQNIEHLAALFNTAGYQIQEPDKISFAEGLLQDLKSINQKTPIPGLEGIDLTKFDRPESKPKRRTNPEDAVMLPSSLEQMLWDWNRALKKRDEYPHSTFEAVSRDKRHTKTLRSDALCFIRDTNNRFVELELQFDNKILEETDLRQGIVNYLRPFGITSPPSELPHRLLLQAPADKEDHLLHIAGLFAQSGCCKDARTQSLAAVSKGVTGLPQSLDEFLLNINSQVPGYKGNQKGFFL